MFLLKSILYAYDINKDKKSPQPCNQMKKIKRQVQMKLNSTKDLDKLFLTVAVDPNNCDTIVQ